MQSPRQFDLLNLCDLHSRNELSASEMLNGQNCESAFRRMELIGAGQKAAKADDRFKLSEIKREEDPGKTDGPLRNLMSH
jgi:hypothetical protein